MTTRTYFIRNINASERTKAEALTTIKNVIAALGLDITIPEKGDRPERQAEGLIWEALIMHGKNSITATINVYSGHRPTLELPHLDISDRAD